MQAKHTACRASMPGGLNNMKSRNHMAFLPLAMRKNIVSYAVQTQQQFVKNTAIPYRWPVFRSVSFALEMTIPVV